MRIFYRVAFVLVSLGLFSIGLLKENLVVLALSMTLGYILIPYLEYRFTNARGKMIDQAVERNGMTLEEDSICLPFSNNEGVFVLKNDDESRVVKVSGTNVPVHRFRHYELTEGDVKKGELEKKFLDYVFLSKAFLNTMNIVAMFLALFYIYQDSRYGYLIIPIVICIINLIMYSSLNIVIHNISYSKTINSNKEKLHELMTFYGQALLGMTEPKHSTTIVSNGDIVVRFERDGRDEYYYIPLNDLIRLEWTKEQTVSP
ncbi:hypothetical protein [Rossellomorea marisflavi]|uniref:hypothetical protein n=1 Tax=Rossellomorea marisflavi TaxID=189381 RepID=UPI003FA190F4